MLFILFSCFIIPQIYAMDQECLWGIVYPDRCVISQSNSEPELSENYVVFPALSNICKKTASHNESDIKKYNGPLLLEHKNYKQKEIASVRINPKKCLFMGNYNSIEQGYDNKIIQKKIIRFGKSLNKGKFNIYEFYDLLLKKRFDQHVIDSFLATDLNSADVKEDAIDQDENIFFNRENNAEQINVLKNLQQHNISISTFAVSNDGLIAIVGFNCHKNNLFLFNQDGKITLLEGHIHPVTQVQFNNKGTLCVTSTCGSVDNCIVWSMQHRKQFSRLVGQDFGISNLAINIYGEFVVSLGTIVVNGENFKRLIVWNVFSEDIIADTIGSIPDLESIVFCNDSTYIMGKAADQYQQIYLWKINAEKKSLDLFLNEYFSAVTFDHSNMSAAIADYEGKVRIFDVYNTLIRTDSIQSFNGIIRTMLFNKASTVLLLAGVSMRGTVFSVWNIIINTKKDIFFVESIPTCPSTFFSFVRLNEEEDKVLLCSSSCFIIGELRWK
jgi:hypothetical protein